MRLQKLNNMLLSIVVAAAILLSFIGMAYAQPFEEEDEGPKVTINLYADKAEIAPGDTITIAIEKNIIPHWHTYWTNYGDSGSPLTVDWTMPEGFTASAIQWPAPKKITMGPLANYGYETQATLIQTITAPDMLPEGPITFTADLSWLTCEEICIPEEDKLSLTFNTANSMASPNVVQAALDILPTPQDNAARFYKEGNQFVLEIEDAAALQNVTFYPYEWGLIKNIDESVVMRDGNTLTFKHNGGERSPSELEEAVFVITHDGHPIEITAQYEAPKKAIAMAPGASNGGSDISFAYALFAAFVGGLILNLMPCVFPVLSLKALSLVKLGEKDASQARLSGVAYTAGILLCFLALAGLLIGLRAAGAEIGWGFQLQNPIVITALAYLMFLIGLNLSGVFEVGGGLMKLGGNLAAKDNSNQGSVKGSFFTGLLAAVLAAPCMAPFMGVAIGYTITQPPAIALIVFAALALGLAAPYALLAFVPSLQKFMPRPGAWMNTFKEVLAFPMYLTAVWLVWVLSQQAGAFGVLIALGGMVAITFLIWLKQKLPNHQGAHGIVTILILIPLIFGIFMMRPASVTEAMKKVDTIAYSPQVLEETLQGDEPVFVEMTAAWCVTCQVNKRVALQVESTQNLFAQKNVQFVLGDWTNRNAEITKYLAQYGRNGVPLYVFYGARDAHTGERPAPEVLPQLLTPGVVASYIE